MLTPSNTMLPFSYLFERTIAASSSDSGVLVLGVDSTFLLYGFEAYTSLDNNNLPDNFTVLIRDLTTGRELSNAPLRRSVLTSNAFNFLPEGQRIYFPRGEQFQFDINNLATQENTIGIVMKGYKVFGDVPGL